MKIERFINSNMYLRSKFTANVKRNAVALQVGVPANVLSQWISETDPRPIPPDKIVALSKACPGVRVEELLIMRLQELLGPAEMEALWAMKALLAAPSREEAYDACVVLARASHDCDEQLAAIVDEEALYDDEQRHELAGGAQS